MDPRHRATYQLLFELPTRTDIPWEDIVELISAFPGGRVTSKPATRGRHYFFEIGRELDLFHRRYDDRRYTDKHTVEQVRRFLLKAGARP